MKKYVLLTVAGILLAAFTLFDASLLSAVMNANEALVATLALVSAVIAMGVGLVGLRPKRSLV